MMRSLFCLYLLICLTAQSALAVDDDLAPPDATPYLEIMITNTDLDPYLDERDTGLSVRFGFRFNENQSGPFTWSGEGAISLLGDTSKDFSETRVISDGSYDLEFRNLEQQVRVNGFELGARAELQRLLYFRGGAFIYSLNEKERTQIRQVDTNTGDPDRQFSLSPASDSTTGLGPYLAVGTTLEFDPSFTVVLEYSGRRVSGELLDTAALGIRLTF